MFNIGCKKVKVSFGQRPGEEMTTMLKQSSDLFYCKEGGNVTCCYAQEICEDSTDLQENQVNLKRHCTMLGHYLLQITYCLRCLKDPCTF